jgi:hypothetical protein
MLNLIDVLDKSLDNPDEWVLDSHTINHINGLRLWMANGAGFFKVYSPTEHYFGWRDGKRLWKKACVVREHKLAERLVKK